MSDQNITTFLRVKPSKQPSGYFQINLLEQTNINVSLPDSYKSDYVDNTKLNHSFTFNGIIEMAVSQDEVFKQVGLPAVKNALEGYNSTIFVYGQTGSGKTFTLTGGSERYADRGIIPRAISAIFNEAHSRTDVEIKVNISYFQIYNEQGYDLLAVEEATRGLEDLPRIKVLEDDQGGFHLKNLSVHPSTNEEEALNLLFIGDINRAVAETPMNLASSRSHCIFLLTIETREHGSDKVRRSKLNLIDLAGSERVGKTNAAGSILREAKSINSSLFYLEVVITALHEKAAFGRNHIPYRNSLMTSVLRDSLGGNCKTTMIATISAEQAHTDESLSTCRFAQRVSQIKNRVTVNEELDPAALIRRLRNEILTLREEVAFLKGETDDECELSSMELTELRRTIAEYCEAKNESQPLNIGRLTLTKIKESFNIFRSLVWDTQKHTGSATTDNRTIQSKDESSHIVEELKAILHQKDQEIAILVNMIKQGKTATDITAATAGDSSGSSVLSSSSTSSDLTDKDNDTDRATLSTETRRKQEAQSYQRRERQREKERQREGQERQERILRTRLFGVPPPPQEVLDDPSSSPSFEWFQSRSGLKAAIDDNIEALKNAIREAKSAGEAANKSKSAISYLKSSVEAIRKERAYDRRRRAPVVDEGKHDTNNEITDQDDYMCDEERILRDSIDREKKVYQDSLETVRRLKPQIEHIRKLVEKSRSALMQQYDQWFAYLHSRTDPYSEESQRAGLPVPQPSTTSGDVGTLAASVYSATSVMNTNSSKGFSKVDDDIEAFYKAKDQIMMMSR